MARMTAPDDGPPVLVAPPSVVTLLAQQVSTLAGLTLSARQPATGTVWRFETGHGQPIDFPNAIVAVWEKPPYVMLVRLVAGPSGDEQAGGSVLAEAVIGTRLDLRQLRDKALATMTILLRAALGGRSGWTAAPLPAPRARPGRLPPLALARGHWRRSVHRWQQRLLVERWGIGSVAQSAAALIAGEALQRVDWVLANGVGNLADPHPWPGTSRILCEEFAGAGGSGPPRGQILALELDAEGRRIVGSRPLLGGAFHRSYPGVVIHEGEALLLPETPERGQTVIYRLSEAGAPEPLCAVAPRLRMADPTLFWHGGRAWIAYSDLDIGEHDNLCLLHADSVGGPWRQHRLNPVKVDIRSSRPAGPVLRHDGRLYRPAQDCAWSYGAAVVLHRIDTLTLDAFAEVPIRRIEPSRNGPFPHGLHTLSSDGQRLFVDGKRRVLALRGLAAKLRRRVVSFLPGTPMNA